jgi:hypothetical protein
MKLFGLGWVFGLQTSVSIIRILDLQYLRHFMRAHFMCQGCGKIYFTKRSLGLLCFQTEGRIAGNISLPIAIFELKVLHICVRGCGRANTRKSRKSYFMIFCRVAESFCKFLLRRKLTNPEARRRSMSLSQKAGRGFSQNSLSTNESGAKI